MKGTMKKLLSSKKFWVALCGTIGSVGATLAALPDGVSASVIAGTIAYVLGQGLADFGKEGLNGGR